MKPRVEDRAFDGFLSACVHRDVERTLRKYNLEPLAFTPRDMHRAWRSGLVTGIGVAAAVVAVALAAVCTGLL